MSEATAEIYAEAANSVGGSYTPFSVQALYAGGPSSGLLTLLQLMADAYKVGVGSLSRRAE
jgi:hypothetical protein